jgi:RND family efflux transporter MFP subunit
MNIVVTMGLLTALIASTGLIAQERLDSVAAQKLTTPKEVLLDSTVEAVNQATVSAQTGGQVQELLFDVDDFVEKDSLIVKLRDTEQQALVNKAEAGLKESHAQLVRAKDEHARIVDIYSKKLVAKTDLDRAEEALRTAEARTLSAKASLEQAKEQLEYTRVKAPYSGIVIKRHVQVGEIANPGQPLLTGISLDRLRTVVAVPQNYIAEIRKHTKAKVLLPNGDRVLAERLTIFPFAEPLSNTFRVRVDLPNGVAGLFPGMFIKTAFILGESQALAIPEKAMVYRGEVAGVYVINKEGKIGFRHIRPGNRLCQDQIAILAGLDEGEMVAIDPIAAGVVLKKQLAETSNGE